MELASAYEKIILLESGSTHPDKETQELYDLTLTGLPLRKKFVNRVREYGGTCNAWTGRTMTYSTTDFENRAWVPHSGWPIELVEIEQHYQQAANYLDIPSPQKFNPEHWYSQLTKHEQALFHSPNFSPTVSLWAKKDARFDFGSKVQQSIAAKRNIDIVLSANLMDLALHPDQKQIKSANAKSLNGNLLKVEAKFFILACGGLENARLLLLSNQHYPKGIGNLHDQVGRYFMEHPKFDGGIIELNRPARLNHLVGRPILSGKIRLGLSLSNAVQQKERLLNPHLTMTPVFSEEVLPNHQEERMAEDRMVSGRRRPHHAEWAFYYLRHVLQRGKTSKFKISNYLEQAPNPESRVYLGKERDSLGQLKLVLDWHLGAQELKSIERLHFYLNQQLEGSNLGTVTELVNFSKTVGLSDASHHMGTTRMSEQRENGVVDKNCKVFGIGNLYIAGSSVFPTSGHANPTFTILALAIRLAEYIKKQ